MAGEAPVANPWASYGLNPDGTAIVHPKQDAPAADPRDAKITALEGDLRKAQEQLSKIPGDFEGMSKKMAVVDKLVAALGGGELDPKTAEYKRIWSDLKEVSKVAAPGFYKQMLKAESDPDGSGDSKAEKVANALAQARLSDLNTRAHETVIDLAKGVFRGLNAEELAEAVYPFEATMTEMINANPQLAQRFVNGDMGLVKEMFQRLAKPHLAGRLRQKQATLREPTTPRAMPRGAQGPSQGEGGEKPKADLKTRQGREAFHKAAIGRFMDRRNSSDE